MINKDLRDKTLKNISKYLEKMLQLKLKKVF